MKNIVIAILGLIIIGLVVVFLVFKEGDTYVNETPATEELPIPVEIDEGIGDGAEPLPEEPAADTNAPITIGQSVSGNAIELHRFGTGAKEVLVVGGVHSGFAPNTVTVAENLRAGLEAGSVVVPDGLTVSVITNLNPDAQKAPNTLAGRLNSNNVDLNRNFDCDWSANGTWRATPVSGGDAAFSEPEAQAIRDYVAGRDIAAAVVYYAADGGVYASNCGGALDATIATLTGTYATAAGYTANEEFTAYTVSGDLTNWLAKTGVPAIGVLLSDYENAEWRENQAGIKAVLNTVAGN